MFHTSFILVLPFQSSLAEAFDAELESQDDDPDDQMQASALKFP
jgi:hypothetical protein